MHATCRLGLLVCHEPNAALYTLYIKVYKHVCKLQARLRLMTPAIDLSIFLGSYKGKTPRRQMRVNDFICGLL